MKRLALTIVLLSLSGCSMFAHEPTPVVETMESVVIQKTLALCEYNQGMPAVEFTSGGKVKTINCIKAVPFKHLN